jgi:hypothetical protein
MNCRDLRDVADSFLCEELLTETNHEILRHLEVCPSCRREIDARRRLRAALRSAFDRAPDLQPTGEFAGRLRARLRSAAVPRDGASTFSRGWFALAAGLVLAAAVGRFAFVPASRSTAQADALARDAIGDHRNCALKERLVRMPMPLDEAARRFDRAYRLLLTTPPDDLDTPDGPARVIERHSCEYGGRRFGHVILQYRGRVVSLLVTGNERTTRPAESADALPHVIGRPTNGLSVVSVDGSHHAIVLVGDLATIDLTQLSRIVSLPLAESLRHFNPERGTPIARLITPPVRLASAALLP